MTSPAVVHLVPHTHWDREWYQPFQTFRLRLVELIDGVLDEMEADAQFAFTLDGQLATVDDYLEIRPESEERIRRHIAAGRLAVGPWQILMDEFLVSGETIVRNLERGCRRAEQLGGAMPAGYLPDMFGHIAQMPQILRRAGIQQAVVWRGVPAAIRHHAFGWSAPDGSTVRAEYLAGSYGNAASLLVIPDRLPAKLDIFRESMRPYFGDDPLLAMYGADHSAPLPGLVALIQRMNDAQDRYQIRIDTLADYLRETDGTGDKLPHWNGELRSSARANVLMGVTSARIEIKAACARAERLLERYAEPLQALYGESWPERYLDLAWDRVVANSAHDSICGCSVDPVAAQVEVRYAEAEQIANGLVERALRRIAESVPAGSSAIVNPSPHPRSDVVELNLAIPASWDDVALELPDGSVVATQEVGREPALLFRGEYRGSDLPREAFRRMHGREMFGRWVNGFRIDSSGGRHRLTFEVDAEAHPEFLDMDEIRRELDVATQAAPDDMWQLRIAARPRRTLVASVPAPALGWTAVRAVAGDGAVTDPVRVTPTTMHNGLVTVAVGDDGTLSLSGGGTTLTGVGRLVDRGDYGDSYNYAPPADDTLVDRPEDVRVDVLAEGPVRGRLIVTRGYRWPLAMRADGSGRSAETARVKVGMLLELRAGEPFVRVRLTFDNPSTDHRLRFHLPLPAGASGSAAEGQFAVVERGLVAEGGHGEVPLPTFPARGFVDAGGVAALLDHVTEYEVVEGRELALTVLRSIGLISRNVNPYRAEPAGPESAIPGAQGRGPRTVSFAVYPHSGSWSDAGVLHQMERYQHPFRAVVGTGRAKLAARETRGIELLGEGVVLSSLCRTGEWIAIRLVCECPDRRAATLRGDFDDAREVDILGRRGAPLVVDGGELRVDLAPWEIRTLLLRPHAPDRSGPI